MARSFAVVLGSLVWLARAAAAENAPEPPIAPDSGYTVQLCGQCDFPRVVTLSVSGKQAFRAKEEPKVVEAGLGTERSQALAGAFTPEWTCATTGQKPPCIVNGLTLKVADAIQRAGTYTVVISLQPSSQPLLPRWKLQVVQAAAQLDAQPISITRYRYWPGADETPPLEVRNTADSARLTLTAAGQWDAASSKGRVEIAGPLPDIKPREKVTLPYTLAGDFPEGKITHTLRFDALQLAAPATVTVEVATRWSAWYLWAAVWLGLLAGYYVKVVLRDRVELAKARVQADALLTEADGAWNRIQDPDFRAAIDPLRTRLRTARGGTDVNDIKDRHDRLAEGLKSATMSHATRLQDARKALEVFRSALKPDWRIPALAAPLLAARNGLAEVEAFLANFNASDAQTRVDTLRDQLGERIREAYGQWPVVQQTLVRLSAANAGIPAPVVATVATQMQNAPGGWQTIKPTPIPATDADIVATLEDYESKLAFANGVLMALVNRLELEWNAVLGNLTPVRPRLPHPPLVAALETQWQSSIAELRRGAQDAAGALDITDIRLQHLQQAWFDAYTGQLTAPDAAMELQLNNREFVLATTTLARHFPAAGGALGAAAHAIVGQAAASPARSGAAPTPATPAQATPWFPYVQPFEPSPTEVIRRSQLIQSAVVLIVMTVSLALGAVTTNQGSWADLFHAFTLAFAADVTLDALLARLKT